MQIILLRHGPAGRRDGARWPDDDLRPLTARGSERTRQAVRGLRTLLGEKPAILTSGLVRALQTAQIVSEEFDDAAIEVVTDLAPGGSRERMIRRLSDGDASAVLLVGHEPELGALAGALAFGAPAALPLKKAGACSVTFDGSAEEGSGRLDWLLPPRVLRRMARARSKAAR